MTPTHRSIRRRVAAMLAAGSVVAMLSGCSVGSSAGGDPTVLSNQPSSTVATPRSVATDLLRVELRFGDELAIATLVGTPAAREFAAMLPLQLDLHDPMGQAKSGALPQPLDITGVEPVFDPTAGQLYYWVPSHTFAILYEDFGHSVPDPGLVRLGAVSSGIDRIAEAGNAFTVRIDLLAAPDPIASTDHKTGAPSV